MQYNYEPSCNTLIIIRNTKDTENVDILQNLHYQIAMANPRLAMHTNAQLNYVGIDAGKREPCSAFTKWTESSLAHVPWAIALSVLIYCQPDIG